MEVRGEPQSGASCSSSPRDCSAVSVSSELLTAGSGGRGGDGRVAAAWGVHVRQGACGRGSGGGRSAAPCPGLAPPRGHPGWPRGLCETAAAGVGFGGLGAGARPRAWMVLVRMIVGAHFAKCSSRTPPLRLGPVGWGGLRSALRVRLRAGGGSRSL